MSVNVVGTILSIVLDYKDDGIVTTWPVRDRIHYATERQVVIRHGGGGARQARARASGVIVGQVEQYERGQLKFRAFVGLPGVDVGPELAQEFVGAELIGVVGLEVGKQRVEVIAQCGLGGLYFLPQWNRPRPWTRPPMRITNIRRQRIALLDFRARAGGGAAGRSSLFWRGGTPDLVAPLRTHEFAVIPIAQAVTGQIIPQKAGAGI